MWSDCSCGQQINLPVYLSMWVNSEIWRTSLAACCLWLQLKKDERKMYSVTLEEDLPVRNLKPAVVKVYDYYQTSKSFILFSCTFLSVYMMFSFCFPMSVSSLMSRCYISNVIQVMRPSLTTPPPVQRVSNNFKLSVDRDILYMVTPS